MTDFSDLSMTGADAPQGGGDYKRCPAGTHVARCIGVVDLGTQEDSYMGDEKLIRKIRVSFELPNERAVFKEEEGEQPFFISKEYTFSFGDRANLRKDLESWRGKVFTEEQARVFNIFSILGLACMINVVHKTSKKGKDYATITGISGLVKGVECPKRENPLSGFMIKRDPETNEPSAKVWDVARFDALPTFLQEKIKLSKEYQSIFDIQDDAPAAATNVIEGESKFRTVDGKVVEETEDDLPF